MLGWGVLGLGNIAHRFVESLAHFDEAEFYAGASYTESKRKEFEEKYHPHVLYDNYEDLLNDENVDVVYVALPHGMHFKWVMEALKHNKCVLVEKPSFLTKEEAVIATKYAKENNLFFMEAMKTRFIPLVQVIKKEIDNGLIGDIISVENYFNHGAKDDLPRTSYLFDKKQGGMLYDCGIYNIGSILDYIRDEVVDITNDATIEDGVDIHDRVTLTFKNGAKAYFECAMDDKNKRSQVITGTKGKITMDYFYRPTSAIVQVEDEEYTVTRELDYDDFYNEIEAVHKGIAYLEVEAERLTHQDMIDEIDLLERIHEVTFHD